MTNTAVAEHNSDTTGLEPPASPPLLWKTPLVSGVLTLIVGALVLGWPETSILVTATLFGVFLLVAGLAQVFVALTLPGSASGRVLLFIGGALSLVLAHLSFRHFGNAYAVLLLAICIGVGLLFLDMLRNEEDARPPVVPPPAVS